MCIRDRLKPVLARGAFQIIGATTAEEFRKYLTKDPAFERRFQTIDVEEPSVEDTVKILTALKPRYEAMCIRDSERACCSPLSCAFAWCSG